MAINQIIILFGIAVSCIHFIGATDICNEIECPLRKERNIKWLLGKYETDSLVTFKDDRRVLTGKNSYEEYISNFEKFTKMSMENDLAKHFGLKELAQKMREELKNMETNKVEEIFRNLKGKLVEIRVKMVEIHEISQANIYQELWGYTEDAHEQDAHKLEFGQSLPNQIVELWGQLFNEISQKTVNEIEITKQRTIEHSGLLEHQAKFFIMTELNLAILGQLRTITEDNENSNEQLEEIIKGLTRMKGKIAEKLKIGIEKAKFISEFAGKTKIKQIFREKFENFRVNLEEIKEKMTIEEKEKQNPKKHGKENEASEKHVKRKRFVEKMRKDIYFLIWAKIVMKEIGKMEKIIEEMKGEARVKGVENIRKSFDVLGQMREELRK